MDIFQRVQRQHFKKRGLQKINMFLLGCLAKFPPLKKCTKHSLDFYYKSLLGVMVLVLDTEIIS